MILKGSKNQPGKSNLKRVLLCIAVLVCTIIQGQITIVNSVFNSFNITPRSLFQVNISNATGKSQGVYLKATLFDAANEIICQGQTSPFIIKVGFNPGTSLNFQVAEFNYGSVGVASYVKTLHILPAGNYKYCVELISTTSEITDQYCNEEQSEAISYLNLVTPFDRDTVESEYPLLIWTHSDPFSALSPGEFFRIMVTPMNANQTAEEALLVNQPVFVKDYLTTHDVQYPVDAPGLQAGHNYAWGVEELSGGIVVQKTEAWQFTMNEQQKSPENKYAVLKKTLDAGYYEALGNKVFFRFEEEYGGKILSCNIYDDKNQLVKPKTLNEKNMEENSPSVNAKVSGYNRFEINLDDLGLKKGFYRLEVMNEKKEKFLLKIYVE